MAQQISDLVINLNADTATFTEQMRRARGQLSEMATNADISAERVRRLEERIAATVKGVADSNAHAMEKLQSQQAQLADSMNNKLKSSEQAIEAVKENTGQYSQQLQYNQGTVAATLAAQDKLTESYYRQIDSIKQLSTGMKQLDALRKNIRAARDAGKLDQGNYLTLVTAASDKGLSLVEEDRAATAAKEAFLQKLRDQSALFKASASDAAAYRAQQLGITQEAAPLVAAIRDQEIALRRQADQKRAAEIASRGLKAALKEQEVAERAAAQEAQRAESQRASYLQGLREQIELQGKSAAEIHEYRAAQLGVSQQAAPFIAKLKEQDNAWKQGAVSAGQYRMAMRQLPMQITDVVTSLASGMPIWLVTIQQGGQIKDSFGGIGNALKALMSTITPAKVLMGGMVVTIGTLAYGAYDTSKRMADLNRELSRTNGVSGLTKDGLQSLVTKGTAAGKSFDSITDSLKALVSAGVPAGTNFLQVSQAISSYSKETGESLDSLAAKYTAIAKDPTQGILALNESLHFLTAEQYANIRSLEQQGKHMDAVKLASDLAADAMHNAADKMKSELSSVESYMRTLKDMAGGMWDAITGVFRDKTGGEVLGELQSRAASIEAQIANSERTGYNQKNGKLQAWRDELDMLYAQIDALNLRSSVEKGIQAANESQKKGEQERLRLAQQQDSLAETLQTREEKRAKLIAQTNEAYKNGIIKSKELRDQQIARINEQFKDKSSPKYKTPAGDKAEDSTQADLLALQSQLEVLRKHTSINDTISQQRQELWKAQAQFTVLEEAATKRQLSAQEKSLLSSKDKVLALAEQKAVLGDQVKYQERLNKLQDASTKYVTQMAEKKQAIRDSAGFGDRDAQRKMEEAQLRQGWKNQGGNPDKDVGFQKQLDAVKSLYAEEDRLRGEWQNGASSAWGNYMDQASDAAGMTKSLFTSAFSGMEDSLTSFATTGKFQFKGFATSVISDLTRIATRLAISSALQSIFGAIGGSLGGAAAGGSSAAGANAFSSGAYNNLSFNAKGGVYSSPGLSAYSGQIVNRPTFFAFAKGAGVMGEAGPEAILPLKRGADGSLGVRAIAAQGGNLSSAAPQVYITVESNGLATSNAPAGFEQFGSEVGKVVGREYIKLRDKDLRQGGVLRRAIDGR